MCHNRPVVLWPRRKREGFHVKTVLVAAVVGVALASAAGASRAIPPLPAHIPPAARLKVEPVTKHASLATSIDADPFVGRREVFEYLLDHPEFATHVTRALRFARYRIWRTSEGLEIDDGWGTKGVFEVVYAAPGTRVMYARGVYEQRLLPDIRGQAVVMVD